jgi:hypothetical protein
MSGCVTRAEALSLTETERNWLRAMPAWGSASGSEIESKFDDLSKLLRSWEQQEDLEQRRARGA